MSENEKRLGSDESPDVLDQSEEEKNRHEDVEDDLTDDKRSGDERRRFAYLERMNLRSGLDRREENAKEDEDADEEL